jgi:hypothetical protein
MVQDRDQWRDLVNTLLNLGVPAQLAAPQEGLSCVSKYVSK